MTTQTKTFIELSDILSLRVECGKCESTITLPLKRDMNFERMNFCPNCGESWLVVGPTSKANEMASHANAIAAAWVALNNWQETLKTCQSKGFSLSLEIRADDDQVA